MRERALTWRELAAVIVVIAVAVFLLLPAVSRERGPARRVICTNRLKQLALAMHEYHDKFGAFPPAYTVDGKGNRLHSWRVLLLPFLENQELYDKIRLDEPWDSEYNRPFHRRRCGDLFLCAEIRHRRDGQKEETDGLCSYSVVVGDRTPFPGSRSVSLGEITDGLSQTVLLVETTEPFCWMDPNADLTFEAALAGVNNISGGVGSFHGSDKESRGANVARADGSVTFVADTIDPLVWKASLTKGDEPVPPPGQ